MTTTADWLHLKLGLPLADYAENDAGIDGEIGNSDANLIVRQRARAAQPFSVVFPGR